MKNASPAAQGIIQEGFAELNQEDKEMYLFLRGGFAAK